MVMNRYIDLSIRSVQNDLNFDTDSVILLVIYVVIMGNVDKIDQYINGEIQI